MLVQLLREQNGKRSFSGAAECEVPNTDDWVIQSVRLENSRFVELLTNLQYEFKRSTHVSLLLAKLLFYVASSILSLSWMNAITRSVAPVLSLTTRWAFSPR